MSYVARQNDEFERVLLAVRESAVSPSEKTMSESTPYTSVALWFLFFK